MINLVKINLFIIYMSKYNLIIILLTIIVLKLYKVTIISKLSIGTTMVLLLIMFSYMINNREPVVDISNNVIFKNGIKGNITLVTKHKDYPYLKQGDGRSFPKHGNICHIHYIARLCCGKIIDTTKKRGKPLIISIGRHSTIPAIEYAVKKMSLNQRALIVAPYNYAYGQDGYGDLIPPFSTVLFEVSLFGIHDKDHITSRLLNM